MLKLQLMTICLIVSGMLPLIQPMGIGAQTPDVVAEQWIIVDGPTGTTIAAENATTRRPMASLTKVMTAVVAIERGHLDMPVTITQGDKIPESSAGFFVGTTSTLDTLLHGLLLASGNDAAMAIARAVGGSAAFENPGARAQFVTWMNDKAAELGLANTSFQNPHGLDETGHYSTPEDLARLTRYALSIPEFREIIGTAEFHLQGYSFYQGNQLPTMLDNVVGGKTGWTDGCGRCLIEVVTVDDRDVVIVLMGSDLSWYNDAVELVGLGSSLPRPADSSDRANAHFDALWERTDSLVAAGVETRSWIWGTALGDVIEAESDESSTGIRYVKVFDKGLMEINHPYSEIDSGWYITPGRLASDLIHWGATLPLAGDLGGRGPGYDDLANQDWSTQTPGTEITAWMSSAGRITDRLMLADYGVTSGAVSDVTNIAVASVFENYLAQTGPIIEAGETGNGPLFDPPLFAFGYPITEAFWVKVPENGSNVDVLVQCFERRCLTYTPSHDVDWQIEMSNIGLHYELWTTGQVPPVTEAVNAPGDRPFRFIR